jgi:hypothetical protein|tara:strand:- start:30 stop:455 length:426 start_codon:yes stop_codon:yes gene_type:complete
MLTQLTTLDQVHDIIADDPVRPHIQEQWRLDQGREVYAYVVDGEPQAVICVAYTDRIPQDEQDLDLVGTSVAVFYTVWSHKAGLGRTIVLETAKHIKETNTKVDRFVTLSPLTAMAERFHIRNGALLLSRGMTCQNFEYNI